MLEIQVVDLVMCLTHCAVLVEDEYRTVCNAASRIALRRCAVVVDTTTAYLRHAAVRVALSTQCDQFFELARTMCLNKMLTLARL